MCDVGLYSIGLGTPQQSSLHEREDNIKEEKPKVDNPIAYTLEEDKEKTN